MREVVDGETRDASGKRFKPNRIVRDLLDKHMDLNEIWKRSLDVGGYTMEELKEFYQLIGYSLYGYWAVFCFNNDAEDTRQWDDDDSALMRQHSVIPDEDLPS